MTSKATRIPPTRELGGEGELKHYTPEEVEEKNLLPYKARTIREMCARRELVHSRTKGPKGRIFMTLPQLRENAKLLEIRPMSETKPATRAAA